MKKIILVVLCVLAAGGLGFFLGRKCRIAPPADVAELAGAYNRMLSVSGRILAYNANGATQQIAEAASGQLELAAYRLDRLAPQLEQHFEETHLQRLLGDAEMAQANLSTHGVRTGLSDVGSPALSNLIKQLNTSGPNIRVDPYFRSSIKLLKTVTQALVSEMNDHSWTRIFNRSFDVGDQRLQRFVTAIDSM